VALSQAAGLLDHLVASDEFEDFLTTPAYTMVASLEPEPAAEVQLP
jgi:hypothetical protein